MEKFKYKCDKDINVKRDLKTYKSLHDFISSIVKQGLQEAGKEDLEIDIDKLIEDNAMITFDIEDILFRFKLS
ncbi:hypothetical protein V6R21_06445 [Limibacter armeniacum]|uniref:hypothetical protein n=1 Tax=Limibacter armeniacum TaxID=466084 RepID=UPI002FE51B5A